MIVRVTELCFTSVILLDWARAQSQDDLWFRSRDVYCIACRRVGNLQPCCTQWSHQEINQTTISTGVQYNKQVADETHFRAMFSRKLKKKGGLCLVDSPMYRLIRFTVVSPHCKLSFTIFGRFPHNVKQVRPLLNICPQIFRLVFLPENVFISCWNRDMFRPTWHDMTWHDMTCFDRHFTSQRNQSKVRSTCEFLTVLTDAW